MRSKFKDLKQHDIDDIIRCYRNGDSVDDLCNRLLCSKPTIYRSLKRIGIEKRSRRRFTKKYLLNEDYFENIDTEEKAYWLGFLFADGNISKRESKNKYHLRMELGAKDREHLEKFMSCIQATAPLVYRDAKNTYAIRITNSKICKDLIRLGCTPRKTFTLKFPILKEDLLWYFIRGYFDGDGCVFKKWKSNSLGAFFLGQIDFLIVLGKFLVDVNLIKPIKRHANKNVLKITFSARRDILKLYYFLYNDCSICLSRKRNKFEETIKIWRK